MKHNKKRKAWVISVDMGYGHARAAYPLKDIAYERIITANSDKIIRKDEKKLWDNSHRFYDWVSRMTGFPIIGKPIFRLYDTLQQISPYYPFRDLSKPNFIVYYMQRLIKKGLCRSIIEYVKKSDIPFITTHFIPALAADFYCLNNIYCIVTDTDINRIWVPMDPKRSKINYLCPAKHTIRRLKQYGISDDRLFFTGFPLPKEVIGGHSKDILKRSIYDRLKNLDPNDELISRYKSQIRQYLGAHSYRKSNNDKLSLTFAIGGAGAQKEIALKIITSLRDKIKENKIRLNIVTGTRLELSQYISRHIKESGLSDEFDKGIRLIRGMNKKEYFENFNDNIKDTDILWTKPSELCFYSGLGIPVIIAPPLGAHEIYNKEWLLNHQSGIMQKDPKYADEWLFDLVSGGTLARLAWNSFLEGPNMGTYNIEKVLFGK